MSGDVWWEWMSTTMDAPHIRAMIHVMYKGTETYDRLVEAFDSVVGCGWQNPDCYRAIEAAATPEELEQIKNEIVIARLTT